MPLTRAEIAEHYPEAQLLGDEFDSAIVGVVEGADYPAGGVVVYDPHRCVRIIMGESGLEEDDAWEYFDTNTAATYMGLGTPVFLYRDIRGLE